MSYETMIAEQRERGREAALALRANAPTMTDNELIASMRNIPKFNPNKDYSQWNVGAPIKEQVDGEYKVFRLLVPHNAADYEGTPSTLTELWAVCVEIEVEETPTLEDRVAELELANAALEDAICEMDAANEERIATIEDALCEMDMG